MTQPPLPKYHQVYLVLRQQIEEGRFSEGLPGEFALMHEFGVARVTVRRALQQLQTEGMVSREPGRGTRALSQRDPAPPRERRAPHRGVGLHGLLENLVDMGMRTTVKVVDLGTVTASSVVAGALQLSLGEAVHKTVRVRSTRAGPVSYITTWVPASVAPAFGRRELSRKPILMLLEEAGIKLGCAHQTVSARLAGAAVAEHLEVAVGAPLLSVQRVIFDKRDRPVQWLNGLYRPDRYSY